jgi:hypothetical protein
VLVRRRGKPMRMDANVRRMSATSYTKATNHTSSTSC